MATGDLEEGGGRVGKFGEGGLRGWCGEVVGTAEGRGTTDEPGLE